MGMELFYVTVFCSFFAGGGDGGNLWFWRVFKGGFGKMRSFAWSFCGEFVVVRVVNVARCCAFASVEKYATKFNFIFLRRRPERLLIF
jgi:hypothetical protein